MTKPWCLHFIFSEPGWALRLIFCGAVLNFIFSEPGWTLDIFSLARRKPNPCGLCVDVVGNCSCVALLRHIHVVMSTKAQRNNI